MGDIGVTIVSLWYDPHMNQITHEDGRVLDDISHLITHRELAHLKKVGGTKYLESDEDDILYELIAPIPGDEMDIDVFYYDIENNVMTDSYGETMFNIFAYITPNDLKIFKMKKQDMKVYGRDGQIIELVYPIDDEPDYTYYF
jgi:hypothetical protein